MKIQSHLLFLAAWMFAVTVSPLRAQLVADGATNTLSNITNTFTGDVTIGTNGSFTLLVLSDNALLTNSANGLIGRNATAKSNEVRLLSATARWLVASNLLVGNDGSFNRLVVSNGWVRNNFGRLGANPSSSNNEALVTGPGSSWTNLNEFNVGNFGSGNRLLVNNGGSVRSEQDSYIGLAGNINEALVTGPDSSWTSLGEFYVGFFGSRNQLVVSNGGSVRNSLGGYLGASTTGSNNLALVTGSGSVWSNASDLYVGFASAGNQLVVSNGATVTANNGVIGNNSSANLNSAILTDPGTRWLLSSNLYVGSNGAMNRLTITNGGSVVSAFTRIGAFASSDNNLALVTGGGSSWTNLSELDVGGSGSGNQLVVSNGGWVVSGNGFIGSDPGANSNITSISGAGSEWRALDFFVGNNGSFNRLIVDNGGQVTDRNGYLGFTGSNNTALVTGTNSLWSNAGSLVVGVFGSSNQLFVSNGGGVVSSSNLSVGSNSAFNRLIIANGAQVLNQNAEVGSRGSANNNEVEVSGLGSVWTNAGTLLLGRSGSRNQLVISNGATVWSSGASFAISSSSSNNLAVVTGVGSVWRNSGSISLADSGDGNRLTITDGAVVQSGAGYIGLGSESSSNLAVVTGSGSMWTNSNELSVGHQGPRNQLVVSNGGTVVAFNSVRLGAFPTSFANRIDVNGGSLRVINTFSLGTGVFDLNRGTNVLNAGLIEANHLRMTNAQGFFEFNGGTLSVRNSTVSNGQLFRVGNGVSPATFTLAGNGTHSFGNGLSVSANAMLTGNGTISGTVIVLSGGKLIPGASVGKMVLSNSPTLQGAVNMEIDKSGAAVTNDQLAVAGAIIYGGTLTVTDIGTDALAAGDRFQLFSAAPFAGSFATITLPPLGPGLSWRNNLLVDGSIEVIAAGQPGFASISLSGTNVILAGTNGTPNATYTVLASTNVALPVTNWLSLVTNQFDANGHFSFTNAIVPGIPQRFFQLRTP